MTHVPKVPLLPPVKKYHMVFWVRDGGHVLRPVHSISSMNFRDIIDDLDHYYNFEPGWRFDKIVINYE